MAKLVTTPEPVPAAHCTPSSTPRLSNWRPLTPVRMVWNARAAAASSRPNFVAASTACAPNRIAFAAPAAAENPTVTKESRTDAPIETPISR